MSVHSSLLFQRWSVADAYSLSQQDLLAATSQNYVEYVSRRAGTGSGIQDPQHREDLQRAVEAGVPAERLANRMIRALSLSADNRNFGSRVTTSEFDLAASNLVKPHSPAHRALQDLDPEGRQVVRIETAAYSMSVDINYDHWCEQYYAAQGLKMLECDGLRESPPFQTRRHLVSFSYAKRFAEAVHGKAALTPLVYPGVATLEELYLAHLLGCRIVSVAFDEEIPKWGGVLGYWHDMHLHKPRIESCVPPLDARLASRIGLALCRHFPEEGLKSQRGRNLLYVEKRAYERFADLFGDMEFGDHAIARRLCDFLNAFGARLDPLEFRDAEDIQCIFEQRQATALAFVREVLHILHQEGGDASHPFFAAFDYGHAVLRRSTLDRQFELIFDEGGRGIFASEIAQT